MAIKNKVQETTPEQTIHELRELVLRAKKGDSSVIPQLKAYLQANPAVWRRFGDLALQSQAAWTRLVAGKDKHLQECIVAKANVMKQALADENSSLLEILLAERVISTWLQLYYHETQSAQQEEKSLKWAEFRLKQLNAANDRHTKAIGALATLKKLCSSSQPPSQSIEAKAKEQKEVCTPQPINGKKNGHAVNRLVGLLNGNTVEVH